MTQAIAQVVGHTLHNTSEVLHTMFEAITKTFHSPEPPARISEPKVIKLDLNPVDERLTHPESLRPLLGDHPSPQDREVAIARLTPRFGEAEARRMIEAACKLSC